MPELPPDEPPENRRRWPRIPFVLRVWTDRPEGRVTLSTANVSACGAFVVGPAPWKMGEHVRITLGFPGLLADCTVDATVRWVQTMGAEQDPGFGIEWDADSADALLRRALELEASALGPLPGPTVHVLIADDSRLIRELLADGMERLAREEGADAFAVTHAHDGQAAWAALQAKGDGFDLVILDVNMPVLGGLQVLERLRETPELASLSVVVISSEGRAQRQAALDAGADLFLPKPIRLIDLLQTVRSLLRLKG